jgi:hypothetical protein
VSRATERLIWLDINPTEDRVDRSLEFLNGDASSGTVASCVPTAVLKTIEEDQLDVEERIQRCQSDARQYLSVRPEMAWSRALQAVTLLGPDGAPASVTDHSVRYAAYMTAAEICFCLGCRGTRLPAELGSPNLFSEAACCTIMAGRGELSLVINAISRANEAFPALHARALLDLASTLPKFKNHLEPWILVEIEPKSRVWIEELEFTLSTGTNASELIRLLPPFYEALGIEDSPARSERLRQKAVQLLMKDRQYGAALSALHVLPERQPKLEAICHEGLLDFRQAAECYRLAGDLKSALNCYRSIPDLAAALELLPELGDSHPAGDTLQWMAKIQKLVAERPDKFTKLVTPAEKKLLEETLERALGVARRKPVAAAKKAPARKPAPRPEPPPEAKESTKAATRPKPKGVRPEELF